MLKNEHESGNARIPSRNGLEPRFASLTPTEPDEWADAREVIAVWDELAPGLPRFALAIYCTVLADGSLHVTRVDWTTEDGEVRLRDVDDHDAYVWQALDYVESPGDRSIREQILHEDFLAHVAWCEAQRRADRAQVRMR